MYIINVLVYCHASHYHSDINTGIYVYNTFILYIYIYTYCDFDLTLAADLDFDSLVFTGRDFSFVLYEIHTITYSHTVLSFNRDNYLYCCLVLFNVNTCTKQYLEDQGSTTIL